MSLPNPGMSFTPFDPLPASDLNDIVENIEALAAGTGFNTGAIPTAALADNSVTSVKIPKGAILLGYSAANANQTGITTSETDLTFASVTVTVPTGGRHILLQILVPNGNSTGGTADQMRFYFKEGTTYLNTATFSPANSFGQLQNHHVLVPNVSAGSHTYKVAVKRTNGTGSYSTNYTAVSPDITIPYFLVFGL